MYVQLPCAQVLPFVRQRDTATFAPFALLPCCPCALVPAAHKQGWSSKATFAFDYCNGYCSYFYFCIFVFLFEDLLASVAFFYSYLKTKNKNEMKSKWRLEAKTKNKNEMNFVLILTFAFAKWKANVRMQIRIKTHAFIRGSHKRGKQMFACK